jgi:hypothetical protein
MNDHFLGDGVYASYDGYQIWLYTSDGTRVTNRVALDQTVFQELLEYEQRLHRPNRGHDGDQSQH